MLHVTNGDHAAHRIRALGMNDEIVAWDDVLHEGPVPGNASFAELRGIRAAFIAGEGWDTYDAALRRLENRDRVLEAAVEDREEIVLWFEHDLYDQLQLLQALAMLAEMDRGRAAVCVAQADTYLGNATESELRATYSSRADADAGTFAAATTAWEAFTDRDPQELFKLARGSHAMRYLPAALLRFLRQYPSVEDGLGESERRILDSLRDGPLTLARAFQKHNAQDDPIFLGDATFASYVSRLASTPASLVRTLGRAALGHPDDFSTQGDYWNRLLELTPRGHALLSGEGDWLAEQGIDRWFGGVHLESTAPKWQWSRAKEELVANQ